MGLADMTAEEPGGRPLLEGFRSTAVETIMLAALNLKLAGCWPTMRMIFLVA